MIKNDGQKSIKKVTFIIVKMGGPKLTKIDPKWPVIKILKIDPKLLKKWYAVGGSKSLKIDLGDPGPQNKNFR
jgi:hypothetical protein